MAVIEVTFDPTIWTITSTTGTDPGDNGYDAGSIYPDLDGATFWAFEASFGAGFAHVGYDGTIINQGAIYGVPVTSRTGDWFAVRDGTSGNVLWAQDDTNHYYAMDGENLV